MVQLTETLVKYNKPVSWSRFQVASQCLKRLKIQLTKDLSYPSQPVIFESTKKGLIVQKIFELFFQHDLGRRSLDRRKNILAIYNKYINSSQVEKYGDISSIKDEMREMVENGLFYFEERDYLKYKIVSEYGAVSAYKGIRLYGKLDFLVWKTSTEVVLVDGKGHKEKEADKDQLLFYALILLQKGLNLSKASLLYWKHGWDDADISVESLQKFLRGDFEEVRNLFVDLKQGISSDNFPASPSNKACKYCEFKHSCSQFEGMKKKVEVISGLSFEDII